MSREKRITKSGLHDLLAMFRPGVTIETKGGYDTGVYFSFVGNRVAAECPSDHVVGGRIVRAKGFCSEGMMMSHEERYGRGGLNHGIKLFEARYEARRAQLQRWLDEYEAMSRKEGNTK